MYLAGTIHGAGKRAFAVAAVLLGLAGAAQAQIQWAGEHVIDLDAGDLGVGAFTSWANDGAAGGDFVVLPGSPEPGNITVAAVNRGQNNVNKNVVRIDNLEVLNRRPANGLLWSNPTDSIFGGEASSFSVEAWVYDEQYVDYECFLGLAHRDNGGGWISFWSGTFVGADGRVVGSSNNYSGLNSDPRPSPAGGVFTYYAFVHDNAASTVDVYINGVFVQTIALTPGLTLATGQPVHIGGYGRISDLGGGFTGSIAKIRLHDDVLSAAQVLNNYGTEVADYQLVAPLIDDASIGVVKVLEGTDATLPRLPMVRLGYPLPTWSKVSGPPALTIDPATGVMSWPNASPAGTYPCEVRVQNTNGSDTATFSIQVIPAPPSAGDLLFAMESSAFAAANGEPTGNWPCLYPPGQSMTVMTNADGPMVEVISGQKWANLNAREGIDSAGSGYRFIGGVTDPIPVDGATVVAVIKPKRSSSNNWDSVVDVFYNRLVLSCNNLDGRLQVWRNGTLLNGPETAIVPEGAKAVVSLVMQPTGAFNVFVNGVQVWENNDVADMTELVPGVPGEYGRAINVGRNDPDGWCAFNGSIGNVYLYKIALDDGDRQELENDLLDLFSVFEPTLSVSPTSIDFGKMKPGLSSSPQTLTLKNVGEGNLAFSAITKGGPDAADFVMDPDPPSLAPLGTGASRTFTVAFAPLVVNGTGPKSATITLEASSGPVTIDLSGTALYGQLEILRPISTVLELGDPAVGQTGPWNDVRFRNSGFGDVTFTSIAITGDFVTEPADLSAFPPLPGNTIEGFRIAAKPTSAGMRTGTLVITYNNGDGNPDLSAAIDLVANTTNRTSVGAGGDIQAAFESVRGTPGAVIEVAAGNYTSSAGWELNITGDVGGVRFVGTGGKAVLPEPPAVRIAGDAGQEQTVTFENFEFSQVQPWEWLANVWIEGRSTKNVTFRECAFSQTNTGRAGDDGQPWACLNIQNDQQTADLVVEFCTFTGPVDNVRDKFGVIVYNTDGYTAIRGCEFVLGRWQIRFADHQDPQKTVLDVRDCTFSTPYQSSVNGYNNGNGAEINIAQCLFSGSAFRGIDINADNTAVNVSECQLSDFTVNEPIAIYGHHATVSISRTLIDQEAELTGTDTVVAIGHGGNSRYDFTSVSLIGATTELGINGPTDDCEINLTDVTIENCQRGTNFWSCRNAKVTAKSCTFINNWEQGFAFCPFGEAVVTANDLVCSNNGVGIYSLCWDGTQGGSVVLDSCWVSSALDQIGVQSLQTISMTVRNSVIEGGSIGVDIDGGAAVQRIESCTMIGTTQSSTIEQPSAATRAVTAPTVLNSIVLGFDVLEAGAGWDAAGTNNLAFIEGDPALVDPKLMFQGGGPFDRPAAMSPVNSLANYRLSQGSPAIDAGTCVGAPDLDFDAKPRPIGGGCDIGAFEFGSAGAGSFIRGDTNNDARTDISDGIFLLNHLFIGGPRWVCEEGADINSDERTDLSDAIYLFNFLFLGGPEIAAPYPACGPDPGGEVCPGSICND